jgi:hypothetical protein
VLAFPTYDKKIIVPGKAKCAVMIQIILLMKLTIVEMKCTYILDKIANVNETICFGNNGILINYIPHSFQNMSRTS